MMSSVRSCSGLTIHINVYCIGICCSQHVCYYCCSIFIISQASCGFCEFRVRTDVEGIKYVVNFDYPNSSEDYIHRIGRTGRSDSTGTSYAFFTPNNFRQAKDLVAVLKEANQVINPKLSEMASRCGNFSGKSRWGGGGNGGGYGGGFRGRENSGPRQNRFGAGKPAYRSSNGYSNGNSYNNRDF